MNRDFHYEGTFAAAVIAGFAPEAAATIAWAAQTVDECTKENINKFYPYLNNWAPVYTCETVTENIKEELSSILSNETSSTLQEIRSIWIPFHFLPGNVEQHITYQGSIPLPGERDIRDFLCMCEPSSNLVLEMIQKAIYIFQNHGAQEKKDYLVMIGILMHVLADTWAHKYFTGTPNYHVNEVSNVQVQNPAPPLPEEYETSTTPPGLTNYSLSYLGHGRAGHYPDYGCMTYQYQPFWKQPGNTITKDGPEDFCCAFEQMEWALRCFCTGRTFTLSEEPSETKDWLVCVKNVVSTPLADQSAVWRQEMADFVDYSSLPADYEFAEKKYDMSLFQSYARQHQAFVLGYLQTNSNILNVH